MTVADNNIDHASIRKSVQELLRNSKGLIEQDGTITPLFKKYLSEAYEAENSDNKASIPVVSEFSQKTKISSNEIGETDRDPLEHQPRVKRSQISEITDTEVILKEGIQERIIGMYQIGMSNQDIASHIKSLYNINVPKETLRLITTQLLPTITEWQSRQLEALYCVIWIDSIHYNIKEKSKVVPKTIYSIMGLNKNGKKEMLGFFCEKENKISFWKEVLTNLEHRGLKDILIICVEEVEGFKEALASIFPQTQIEISVIHQIRNSLRYIAAKDQKSFVYDLKQLYLVPTIEEAKANLDIFILKWEGSYPIIVASWQKYWQYLAYYFKYGPEIRNIISSTYNSEVFHRQIRKVLKIKTPFTDNEEVLELVYLSYQCVSKKWTSQLQHWGIIVSNLAVRFGSRIQII